jgi:DNA-binding Lrp family transcriptional regulator
MKAYILLGLADCDEQQVLDEIVGYEEVEEAHILFGEWDLIVKLKAESAEQVASIVMDKIRKIEDVKLTSTLIVAK